MALKRGWAVTTLVALFVFLACAEAKAQTEDGKVFDDWMVRCSDDPQNAATGGCFIFQNVIINETQQPIMHVAVGYLTEEAIAAAVFTLPLGVRLPPGVAIQIDQNQALNFPFERCTPEGCKVQFKMDEAKLAAFQRGVEGKLAFQDISGRNVTIPFSLKGFTAALAALQ